MSNAAAAAAHDHGTSSDRGFTKLELQLNDYPGPTKTALFGIQHVLVMFTAMVGGPLIVARLLNLPPETRIDMVTGTMIGCGLATIVSALGVSFVGPRLPIVMGVFYIFIGPLVAKLHRFFPPIVTGTTILLIGTGLMKIGIGVATGANTPAFGQPLTLGLAALMIVLILVISWL